jgi:hypothetical protein
MLSNRSMKKTVLISCAILVVIISVWFWIATRFRTSWETVESRFPAAVETVGWRTLERRSGDSNAFPLSAVSRIRQILHPQQVQPRLGFPNSTASYTLEWEQSHARVQCLVRYSEGMVIQIGVRYPAATRQEAIRLRDILRRTFPGECVSVEEIAGSTN